MDNVFNFLANNYIVFLIICGILIFSLIGFLTDSAKNKGTDEEKADKPIEKPKKEKRKKKEEVVESGPTIGELMKEKEEQEKKKIQETEIKKDDTLNPQVQQSVSLDMPITKDSTATEISDNKK